MCQKPVIYFLQFNPHVEVRLSRVIELLAYSETSSRTQATMSSGMNARKKRKQMFSIDVIRFHDSCEMSMMTHTALKVKIREHIHIPFSNRGNTLVNHVVDVFSYKDVIIAGIHGRAPGLLCQDRKKTYLGTRKP